MTGKAVLLLVMTSFIIFSQYGVHNVNVLNNTYDRMFDYSAQSTAYNIAVAGANVAFARLNQLLPAPPNKPVVDNDDIANLSFNGGSFSISCSQVSTSVYRLTSTGTYAANGKNYESKVIITYQPGGWGRFAYYSESEGGELWWGATNVVEGPFHTQDLIVYVNGHPTFKGEASSKGKFPTVLKYKTSKDADYPDFQKGFFTDVDIPMRNDSMDSTLNAANSANAWKITDKSVVYLTFNGSNVNYKFDSGSWQTASIGSKTTNGVIYVQNGKLRVQGTVDGQVTLLCTGPEGDANKGKIFIDDDLKLTDSPRTNPNSNDFLGLVATNEILIANNSNTNNINIEAAIFSHKKGFGAEDYKTRDPHGSIHLFGGIVQKIRQGVGQRGSDGKMSNGFDKDYRYDKRFEQKWPPFYPCGRSYRVMSWYDDVGSSKKYN